MLCTDILENFLLNQKLINNSNETIIYYGSIILVGVIKVPTISYIKIAFIHLL